MRDSGYTRESLLLLKCLGKEKVRKGCVDSAPYSENQLFRMPGSGKMGKHPLRLVRGPFVDEVFVFGDTSFDFNASYPDIREWMALLVEGGTDMVVDPLCVSPGNYPWPTARAKYFRMNLNGRCDANPAYRLAMEAGISAAEFTTRERASRNFTSCGNNMIADDKFVWKTESGRDVCFGDLKPGEYVYHAVCEGVEGTPSACVCVSKDEMLLVYCFNCQMSTFCLPSYNPAKVQFPTKMKLAPGQKYLNEEGFPLNVDLAAGPKWIVLDAPTGSGKTELLKSYLATNRDVSVCSINPRIAMARTGSQRLGLDLYSELTEPSTRLSCTLDYLVFCGSGYDEYDVVVLDEAGMTKDHTVSHTISQRIGTVLNNLTRLLKHAKKVIIMQHQLLESDVAFFQGLVGDDMYDPRITKLLCLDAPLKLHPIRVSSNFDVTLAHILLRFKDCPRVGGRLKEPMLILTTSVAVARAVTAMLREATDEASAKRIYCLVGDTQNTEFNKEFMLDPNSDVIEELCDVMVMTHCSPAGLSIVRHFTVLCILFGLGHVTHRVEYQFSRRLRVRPGLFPYIIAFIEKGYSNRANPDAALIKQRLQIGLDMAQSSGHNREVNENLIGVLSENTAERIDTMNRHYWLWQLLYSENGGSFSDLETIELGDVKDVFRSHVKSASKGIIRHLSFANEPEADARIRDGHDLADIIREEMECLAASTKEKILKSLTCTDIERYTNWLLATVPEESLMPNAWPCYIARAYNLVHFLDYYAYLVSPSSDAANYYRASHRMQLHINQVSSRQKIVIGTKIIRDLIPAFETFFVNPQTVCWEGPIKGIKAYIASDANWTHDESKMFELAFANVTRTKKANTTTDKSQLIKTVIHWLGLKCLSKRVNGSRNEYKTKITLDMDYLATQLKLVYGFISHSHWQALHSTYNQSLVWTDLFTINLD